MSYAKAGASGLVAGNLIEHIFLGCPGAVLTCLDVAEPDYSFLGKEGAKIVRFEPDTFHLSQIGAVSRSRPARRLGPLTTVLPRAGPRSR